LQFGVGRFRVEGTRRDAMRTSGLSVFAVFVAILAFPFAARALITIGALDIPGQSESVVVVDGIAYVAASSAEAAFTGLGDLPGKS
jgi:hypothetical protein